MTTLGIALEETADVGFANHSVAVQESSAQSEKPNDFDMVASAQEVAKPTVIHSHLARSGVRRSREPARFVTTQSGEPEGNRDR